MIPIPEHTEDIDLLFISNRICLTHLSPSHINKMSQQDYQIRTSKSDDENLMSQQEDKNQTTR